MTATPPAAGPADLKTYDVPDPPKQGGWILRCLFTSGAGLLLAAGLIRITRLPHLIWVAEHHPDRWETGPTRLNYIQDRVLYWLREDYDADALRSQALGITEPKVRGAFHEALAGSGDPAQIDAMLAYLRTVESYRLDEEAPKVVDSMLALDKARTASTLMACYEAPGESNAGETEFSKAMLAAIDAKVPPADVLPLVLKIQDPVKRGRFHAALATTKDPAHLDAVLAYARSVVPTNPGSSRPDEWAPLVKSLGEFGPAATPKLQAVLEQTESRSLVSLAAEALRSSDLPFLVRRARALLDEYDAGVPRLAAAAHLVSSVDDGSETEAPAERVAAARKMLEEASARAFMIFEVLRALEPVKDDQAVDFCIVRGLSSFDREIAEWSLARIKERFTPDKIIDTLFSYIAQKTEFQVSEVEVYEGLMKELGVAAATRVAQNLDRLVREAGGDPGEVFWLYKKMGFRLLRELGGSDAIPTLRKFARDTGSYVLTTTKTDGSGRRSREQTEIQYADEVRTAISAIQARAGGN